MWPSGGGGLGCTDSAALNYDLGAVADDGSCIPRVVGCTLPAHAGGLYAGVDPTTPGFASALVGHPTHGLVPWPEQRAVLTHDAAANVLGGCVLAIEGCMDSTALNYDPLATVSSNSWCVPRRRGCMLPMASAAPPAPLSPPTPQPASAAPATSATAGTDAEDSSSGAAVAATPRLHQRDGAGLSVNFDGTATIDDPSSCRLERSGCMQSDALNFDSLATRPDACYVPHAGCLDPRALNFRCALDGPSVSVSALRDVLLTPHVPVASADRASSAAEYGAAALGPYALAFDNVSSDALAAAFAVAGGAETLLALARGPSACAAFDAAPGAALKSHVAASTHGGNATGSDASAGRHPPLPFATIHVDGLCRYPPPPPYALIFGSGAAGALVLFLACVYCRRRSAKVDAATALVAASTLGTAMRRKVGHPAASVVLHAVGGVGGGVSAALHAVPDRQASLTLREVTKLRGRLATATREAHRASALDGELERQRERCSHAHAEAERAGALRKQLEAERLRLETSLASLTADAEAVRTAHSAEADALTRRVDDQRARLEALALEHTVSLECLAAAMGEVEAAQARLQGECAACAALAVSAASASAAERSAAEVQSHIWAEALRGIEDEVVCLGDAWTAAACAHRSAADEAARAGVGAAALRASLDVCERDSADELTALHRQLTSAHAKEVDELELVAAAAEARASEAVQQLTDARAAASEAYEAHVAENAALSAALMEAQREREAEEERANRQMEAATKRIMEVRSVAEEEKRQATTVLNTQLEALERERSSEAARMQSQVSKLKALQTAALAAGSARGRQMLYAETLRQRRAKQARVPPSPGNGPAAQVESQASSWRTVAALAAAPASTKSSQRGDVEAAHVGEPPAAAGEFLIDGEIAGAEDDDAEDADGVPTGSEDEE